MAVTWRPNPAKGVFETILVLDGRPVELDAHLARLTASLAELFPDRVAPSLYEEAWDRCAGVELDGLRITVAPAADGFRVEIARRETPPGPFVADTATKGPTEAAELRTFALAGGLGPHKWADRSLLDEAQARLPAGALPLIADGDGAVLEASRANVFAVHRGALFTPPLDGRLLPGVTRARTIEIAVANGLPVHEGPLSPEDLIRADEVFLTGSVRGIEPTASLDGARLGDRRAISTRLAAELRRAWAGEKTAAAVG